MFSHSQEHVDPDMIRIEANIDDMNPEWIPYVMDKLFEKGANDAVCIPVIMKKGRPGFMFQILASKERLNEMEDVLFAETTTLGLRYSPVICHRLSRKQTEVETRWGTIRVKTGSYRNRLVQVAPEYEDCARIARNQGVPLKDVYHEARREFDL